MEMYEIITRIMELSGMTFDEVFTYFVVILLGSVSAFGSLLCLSFDLGRYLYRGIKKLLRFIIQRLWHKGEDKL